MLSSQLCLLRANRFGKGIIDAYYIYPKIISDICVSQIHQVTDRSHTQGSSSSDAR